MWHEVRRQEKKIRGMMVDYRKRAERRRDFYEKFKADPTQFLQLHGRPCKIHLDATVAAVGDSSTVMMQWQGRTDVLIDRFDVRAHLDYIEESTHQSNEVEGELNYDERHLNYERYRILVQNDYLGVDEVKFLNQIYLEEQFGPIALKQNSDGVIEKKEKDKRKGVAIGFTYEESGSSVVETPTPAVSNEEDSESDESELDFDLCLDLSEVDTASAHELNYIGQRFGLVGNDFYSFLTNDVEEQEALRMAREQEEEKAMYSGRKARRERQAFRERRLAGRVMSPPSYAERKSPVYDKYKSCSKSRSRSASPDNSGAITYITSFGGEEPVENNSKAETSILKKTAPRKKRSRTPNNDRIRPHSKRSRSPSCESGKKSRRYNSSPDRSRIERNKGSRRYSRSRSRSRGMKRSNRSRSASRSRYSRRYSRSRSKSRSRGRSDRRSRSRSRYRYRRSRSRSKRASKSHSPPRRVNSNSEAKSPPATKIREKELHTQQSIPQPSKTDTVQTAPRYYGRNRKDSSSSLEVSSSEETQDSTASSAHARVNETTKQGISMAGRVESRPEAKPLLRESKQEKLKRRMQALLNKQFKQDKRAEREKAEKAEQERIDRAAELRDISIRIRRRERYLRHLGEKDRRSRSVESSDDDSDGTPPSRTLVDY